MNPSKPGVRRHYVVEANGFADGPAQALCEYLVSSGRGDVTAISHPLVAEGDRDHVVERRGGERRGRARLRRPFLPPYSYVFDVVTPLVPPRCDVWFAFNNLATMRALASRAVRRVDRVVYWAVDFVPDRFGDGVMSKVYDTVDRAACRRADLRVELSEAAARGRDDRHRLDHIAPVAIVPMGAWLDRVPTTDRECLSRRKLVFLGHLVPRMGLDLLLDAMETLGPDHGVSLDVIGGGPLLDSLTQRVGGGPLRDHVVLHGFKQDHRDVERILAGGSLAVAPYEPSPDSFTRFADPGKLKSYVAAGLPIILTDVPPNASELVARAGATITEYRSSALADAVLRRLSDPADWLRRREAALAYARAFDWNEIFARLLEELENTG